jgi:hypothetical protein
VLTLLGVGCAQYGVDMYFAGHVHSYERQWPTYQGVPYTSYADPEAPVYIISGVMPSCFRHILDP